MVAESEATETLEPPRNAGESTRSIVDRLREHASVESVFGEPRRAVVAALVGVALGFLLGRRRYR